MKKIIDISKHQGNIDFAAIPSDIEGVIIRAGYGQSTTDEKFERNIKGFENRNYPIGIYWFSYAYTVDQARKEAAKCLDVIRGHEIRLPIFFDWEYDSFRYAQDHGVTPSRRLITDMINAFCYVIHSAGYEAGYYFNEDYRLSKIYENEITYHTWYARYNASISTPKYDLWQFTSKANVAGISGSVDMSYLINETILRTVNPQPQPESQPNPEPQPTLAKKTNEEIAEEVIAGKWGNGLDRMRRLKAAGYSYTKIQTMVNKKLRQIKRKK